jgi:hypothetical protein
VLIIPRSSDSTSDYVLVDLGSIFVMDELPSPRNLKKVTHPLCPPPHLSFSLFFFFFLSIFFTYWIGAWQDCIVADPRGHRGPLRADVPSHSRYCGQTCGTHRRYRGCCYSYSYCNCCC